MKTCPKCRTEKELSAFKKDYRYRASEKVCSWCRECSNEYARFKRRLNPAKSREYQRNRRLANPEENRGYQLKHSYGLSLEQWDELMLNQGGACAICYRDFTTTPNVDHCHKTDKVRGLLCLKCNFALGLIEDSSSSAQRAADYLKRSE